MKPIFICNPYQIKSIRKYIENNKLFKGTDLSKSFITSKEELESREEDIIGKGDAPYTRIFIDPILEWSIIDYYGYEIALNILANWKKTQPPGITFLSDYTQIELDKKVKGKLNNLTREFTHVNFQNIEEIGLPTETFSKSRWKYFKAYALTSSGTLDDISHNIGTAILNNSRKSLEKIVSRIENLPETVGKDVLEYTESYSKEVSVNVFAKLLKEKIDDRLKELIPHNPSAIKVPSNMNLLIIEDNEEHLQVLEESLTNRKGYFEKGKTLFSYTDGYKALTELKKSKNEYQLVLVDLRLDDENGFAQRVHGVDIIEELQTNHPLTSYTIITGMGRKGISELLDIELKFVLSKKQLYSFDTDSEVDVMLTRMFADVSQREKIIFTQYGPKIGLYRVSLFKTNLSALGKEEFNKQISMSFDILKKFKEKTLTRQLKLKTQREFENVKPENLSELHTSLLALRLIYLWLALRKRNKLYCSIENQDEYMEVLVNCEIKKIPPKKPNNIGLSAKKIDEIDGVEVMKIDLTKLWPHEYKVVDEWNKKYKEEIFNKNNEIISKNYSPLYKFIKTYFNYNSTWLKELGLLPQIEFWSFNDLGLFLTQIFEDYKENKEESIYYEDIELMSSDPLVYEFFDRIIIHFLPEVYNKFINL